MAELLYTPYPAGIPKFLKHVQTAGVPEKLTVKYLEQVGFRSKNDRALIGIMKAIGFVDGAGVPTDRWRAYRDRGKARQVMADAVRMAYQTLYATYPDAQRKDMEALHNFFSARSGLSESTVKLAVSTFKTLATEADFDSGVDQGEQVDGALPINLRPAASTSSDANRPRNAVDAAIINVNIELHLPATEDASVYESLFSALRKHVLDR